MKWAMIRHQNMGNTSSQRNNNKLPKLHLVEEKESEKREKKLFFFCIEEKIERNKIELLVRVKIFSLFSSSIK